MASFSVPSGQIAEALPERLSEFELQAIASPSATSKTTHPSITTDDCQQSSVKSITTASRLTLNNLRELFAGKTLAIHISNFYPQVEAQRLSQQLIDHAQFERYFRAPDIGVRRTGMTFFETNGSTEQLLRYYDEAQPATHALRGACAPLLSPVDKLRLELGDLWLDGVRSENAHGRPMLAGIGRVFENGFELPPHQDILARDLQDATLPPLNDHQSLLRQLSANIYLRPAHQGGQLEIWHLSPSLQEQQAIRDNEFQYEGIVDRQNLPDPDVILTPQSGDLVLFDSGHVHAVRACEGGPRVSMSLFIGYRGPNQPLTYWN